MGPLLLVFTAPFSHSRLGNLRRIPDPSPVICSAGALAGLLNLTSQESIGLFHACECIDGCVRRIYAERPEEHSA